MKLNNSPYYYIPLLISFIIVFSTQAQAASMQPGIIKAFQVKGEVTVTSPDGNARRLKRGMDLSQEETVITGKNSRALLLFSNGSKININENSKVEISRYLQEPYDESKKGRFLMLEKDPSRSDTLIRIEQGELVGNVKKLQKNSYYDVETPVGSAGIRGTTFMVSFMRSSDGGFTMKVGNLGGLVELTTRMPSSVTVTDMSVAETNYDPTNTLSTGDVPENSVAVVKAKPGDVEVPNPDDIPVANETESFASESERVQELTEEVENTESLPGSEEFGGNADAAEQTDEQNNEEQQEDTEEQEEQEVTEEENDTNTSAPDDPEEETVTVSPNR